MLGLAGAATVDTHSRAISPSSEDGLPEPISFQEVPVNPRASSKTSPGKRHQPRYSEMRRSDMNRRNNNRTSIGTGVRVTRPIPVPQPYRTGPSPPVLAFYRVRSSRGKQPDRLGMVLHGGLGRESADSGTSHRGRVSSSPGVVPRIHGNQPALSRPTDI